MHEIIYGKVYNCIELYTEDIDLLFLKLFVEYIIIIQFTRYQIEYFIKRQRNSSYFSVINSELHKTYDFFADLFLKLTFNKMGEASVEIKEISAEYALADVLDGIFQYLKIKDLCSVSRVCK